MTMASLIKNALDSEDEDDLEFLRLAALKSLKPKSACETQPKPPGNSPYKPQNAYNKPSTFGAAQTTRHHNRGFRNSAGRIGRNVSGRNGLNSRSRTNTNLISIQTIDPDEPKDIKIDSSLEIPKLILPQDRYHKPLAPENTSKESSGNKFDRYDDDDDSEDSESDSDEMITKPNRRERKNSVELLMDQLENEINLLDNKVEIKSNEEDRLSDKEEIKESDDNPTQNDTLIISETDDLVQIDEPTSPIETKSAISTSPSYKKSISRSPSPEKSHLKSRSRSPFPSQYKSPYRSPIRSRSPPRKVRYSPTYQRVISPLTLNTEVLNTITMAPLSPRSAAFVLQNRQILARRQMSPRRSSSRESSCRRSLTPIRNKSPRRRSRSPIKRSLSPRKRSLSPRQSPRRRSLSPRNNHHRRSPHRLTKRGSNSPIVGNKPSIHKRLGSRPNSRNVSPSLERKTESAKRKRNSRSISLSLSPSPDRNYHKRPLNETTGYVNNEVRNRREKLRKESPKPEKKEDPVLEARRRKFESPVQINNGIIKLKTSRAEEDKEEEESNEPEKDKLEETPEEKDSEEEIDFEENEEILDLNPTLEDLWSDEDSDDDENEGRFKSKPSSDAKKLTILPFRKLTERPVPNSLLPREESDRRERRYKRSRRRRSRSPLKSTNKTELKKEPERERVSLEYKSKAAVKVRTKVLDDEKKKEKSVVTVKSDANKNMDILKTLHSEKNVKRRVKIQKLSDAVDSNVENTEEPEIIIENEDDDPSNKEDDGGDLRAELSRRRAQRLIKAGSLGESLPTRLLKNALQEVVPKRPAVKQSKLTKGNGSSADRRVLILKRLASSPVSQLEPANKVANKEGKLPIHMRLGSNADVEEPVRSERRGKRFRVNRRKKQVQV